MVEIALELLEKAERSITSIAVDNCGMNVQVSVQIRLHRSVLLPLITSILLTLIFFLKP